MNYWRVCEKELPPENRYVLARYSGDNWTDQDDPENVNCVVVKRVLVPANGKDFMGYRWEAFGSGSYLAHYISHWMEIPPCHDFELKLAENVTRNQN